MEGRLLIVAFCVPFLERPTAPFIAAMEQSIPLVNGAGWKDIFIQEVGCPYISAARSTMLRKALDAGADVTVFIDYDLSWRPSDLLSLLAADGDVVAGVYRFKKDEVEYMGAVETDGEYRPIVRVDGCIKGERVPAGFLKLTKKAVGKLMRGYPELIYGPPWHPHIDLFNHGAFEGLWWGEDYAFSRRWKALGEDIWIVPDLSLTHHGRGAAYPGNFHEFMLRQPGGSHTEGEDGNRA